MMADVRDRRGVVIIVTGWNLGSIYIKAQLSVKREQSNAKAPVIGVFSGAIAGLSEQVRMILNKRASHALQLPSERTAQKNSCDNVRLRPLTATRRRRGSSTT
jgi:hypothetical protein